LEIFRLFGSIFIDNDKAVKSIDETDKKGKSLSTRFEDMGKKVGAVGGAMTKWVTGPIAAVGGGLLALTTKAGQTADRLLDLSDITGLSTDTIQEYQYVANQAGVSSEAMTAAVEGLVRKIPQLESEGGRATEQLAKLGISYERLKKMSPDQQIDLLITKLAEMKDPLERNAIGAQLFGGAWKDIAPILGMGADGIKAVRKEAHDLGLVLDRDALEGANEFRKEMDRLKAILGGVINQLGARLAPILREQIGPIVQNTIIPALQILSDLIAGVVEWFASLSPTTQKVILVVVALAAALGPLLTAIGMITSGVGALVGALPALGAAFAAITGPVGLTVMAIIAVAAAIGYLIYEIVKNWDVIKAEFKRIFDAIADFFTKTVPRAISTGLKWLSELPGKVADIMLGVLNFFLQLPNRMFEIGANIVKGLWDGIKSMIEWIRNKISEFIESITGGFKAFLGIHSPSAVFADIGKNISLGLAQGIEKNRPAVSGAVTDTVNPQNITTREVIERSGGDNFVFHVHMDEINDLIKYAKAQRDLRRNTRMGPEMV